MTLRAGSKKIKEMPYLFNTIRYDGLVRDGPCLCDERCVTDISQKHRNSGDKSGYQKDSVVRHFVGFL
jgi:hypothetical protein